MQKTSLYSLALKLIEHRPHLLNRIHRVLTDDRYLLKTKHCILRGMAIEHDVPLPEAEHHAHAD